MLAKGSTAIDGDRAASRMPDEAVGELAAGPACVSMSSPALRKPWIRCSRSSGRYHFPNLIACDLREIGFEVPQLS